MKTFKSIKDLLNRDEMRAIIAGSGSGSGCNLSAGDILACHNYCWPQGSGEVNNPSYEHCMFCCKARKCGEGICA
jgi:hypothetical protein